MKRMVLAVSLVFAFAGMCGGGEETSEDPVVVPVNTDDDANEDDDEGYWCCEYKDDGGSTQYALTEGPAECNTTYSEKEGRWISGNQCIPTCCKSPNDPEDDDAGFTFELTTPKSCVAGSGELLASDSDECEVKKDKPKKVAPRPKPRPRTVTKPSGR